MKPVQKTIRTYFRTEPRCSQKAQDEAVEKYDGKVLAYTDLDEWFRAMRKGDLVGVPFFHRLASNADDLRGVRQRLKAAGVIVLETATDRRTDDPDAAADMLDEARDFYARRGLTTAEAKRMGELGGKMSPATKSRTDRLPNEHAERILNDHDTYPTLKLAILAINNATDARGKKFKRLWNEAHVYREAKRGKLNLKLRRSGPKVKL